MWTPATGSSIIRPMELALRSLPGMIPQREQAVTQMSKGAGIAIGVAIVSGIVGMWVGKKWSTWLYVLGAIGAGYYLSADNPLLGAALMGAGTVTGLAMLIENASVWLRRTPAPAAALEGGQLVGEAVSGTVFQPYSLVGATT